ncbi:hypothetical protein DdX_11695 [Ditylenchus destructor]|uniref:Uncharacterized protein n=1 Tax=Ditylenchus destructor TaxID=166010 RepID=A0AAD4N1M3_9BILA|nr:hypothetical protein DdX_11695 [Ditylenchus destructor]
MVENYMPQSNSAKTNLKSATSKVEKFGRLHFLEEWEQLTSGHRMLRSTPELNYQSAIFSILHRLIHCAWSGLAAPHTMNESM